MKRFLQAMLVLAMCFALAPFVLADEHGRDRDRDRGHHYAYGHDKQHDWDRDRDRDEHHDREHHYAYGHYKHHDRDHDWDRDRDRRADWRTHNRYHRPATARVANNRVPVKIAGPNAGTPITRHTAPPKSQSSGVFGAQR